MAKTNYTALIEQLETVSYASSDNGNRRGFLQARTYINQSDLPESEKETITTLEAANDDSFDPEQPTSLTVSELIEKVGHIFGVSFIKRTTGELRTMSCRLGVKKFLRGGELNYSPAKKHLLTVFSMRDNGYRMIPLDAVQRVSVGGQSYAVGV